MATANKLFDPVAAQIAAMGKTPASKTAAKTARAAMAMDIVAEMATTAGKQRSAAAKDAGPKRKAAAEPKEPKPEIKLPKTPAAVTDLFYKTQQERYALQRQAKALEEVETACREFLINNLPKSEASGISGKVARSWVENKDIVQVQDWPALYGYIAAAAKRNPGVWGLLQKRISSEMAAELFADKVEGKKLAKALKKVPVPVVHLNKL